MELAEDLEWAWLTTAILVRTCTLVALSLLTLNAKVHPCNAAIKVYDDYTGRELSPTLVQAAMDED